MQQQVAAQSFARRKMSPLTEKGQHSHPYSILFLRYDIMFECFKLIHSPVANIEKRGEWRKKGNETHLSKCLVEHSIVAQYFKC